MKIFGIPIFPDQASTFAKDVDALYFFILAVCAFFALTVAVIGDLLRHPLSQDARRRDWRAHRRQPAAGTAVERHSHHHRHGDVRLGRVGVLSPPASARRCDAHLRGGQAVDVEVPAPRRAARDQRAAHPGRPADQDHDQLGRRAAQPVFPGVPHQDGRDSRALHRAVVRGEHARDLPHFLHGVLRHQPRRHDRQRHRARAVAVPGVAAGRQRGWHAGPARRQAVRKPGLQQLPPRQRPGPRPVAERHRRHDRGRCRTATPWSSTTSTCASRS